MQTFRSWKPSADTGKVGSSCMFACPLSSCYASLVPSIATATDIWLLLTVSLRLGTVGVSYWHHSLVAACPAHLGYSGTGFLLYLILHSGIMKSKTAPPLPSSSCFLLRTRE